ncbi:mCG1034951, partial [Mus musculus]
IQIRMRASLQPFKEQAYCPASTRRQCGWKSLFASLGLFPQRLPFLFVGEVFLF